MLINILQSLDEERLVPYLRVDEYYSLSVLKRLMVTIYDNLFDINDLEQVFDESKWIVYCQLKEDCEYQDFTMDLMDDLKSWIIHSTSTVAKRHLEHTCEDLFIFKSAKSKYFVSTVMLKWGDISNATS